MNDRIVYRQQHVAWGKDHQNDRQTGGRAHRLCCERKRSHYTVPWSPSNGFPSRPQTLIRSPTPQKDAKHPISLFIPHLINVVFSGKQRAPTPEHFSQYATNGPDVHRFAVAAFSPKHNLRCSIPSRHDIFLSHFEQDVGGAGERRGCT